MGLDIGPKSAALFADAIQGSGTVVWNGPMGVSEWENFAAGTVAVAKAVAEAAIGGECLDVVEHGIGHVFGAGELEFAHARRIDQAGALRQRQKCAMRGGVAPARIAFAYCAGLHLLAPGKGVGERGFARAGRPNQHHAASGAEPGRQCRNAGCVFGIHRHHRNAAAFDAGKLLAHGGHILATIGLGQHQHGCGTAGIDQYQIALQATQVEIAIQPGHHQHRVDVRGDRLHLEMFAGGAALEQAAAWHQFENLILLRMQSHEIADHGALFGREALARPWRGRLYRKLVVAIADTVAGAVLFADSRHATFRLFCPCACGRKVGAPSQRGQLRGDVDVRGQGVAPRGCTWPSGAIRCVACPALAAMPTRAPSGMPRQAGTSWTRRA